MSSPTNTRDAAEDLTPDATAAPESTEAADAAAATATEHEGAAPIATVRPLALLRSLIPDIGLPLAGFYVPHLSGAGDRTALLTATALAALRVAWGMLRERTLNVFATVMLVAFGVGTVLTLVSGDTEFLLLKNSFTTGAIGLVFLATVPWGRPLTLAAAESFNPARAAEFQEQYRSNPRVRRGHRVCSGVWGSGLLLEAALRIPMVYTLPAAAVVALSEALMIAALAGLSTWNVFYVRRARRRPRASTATTEGPAES
ncbi:VC0807 family protein [Streptomyces marispadix]|uniref:DUF3159 domain-containing protein n=1 Tax=Streptomyces marispadix TaxID=2922868 RepID=A0ABS9SV33_9ACTN|nr:VC0807 family protein [Streptomyces marispadix]MCH6160139.1 hypothetical protein [Streptomyces marispadix]